MIGLQIPKQSAICTGTGDLFTAVYLTWSDQGVKVYTIHTQSRRNGLHGIVSNDSMYVPISAMENEPVKCYGFIMGYFPGCTKYILYNNPENLSWLDVEEIMELQSPVHRNE